MVAPNNADPWIGTEDAAKYLDVSPTWLRSECRREAIRHQAWGRRYRFKRAWLDAWREAHERGPKVPEGGQGT